MFNKTIDEMNDQERCLLRAYGILRERALYWEIQYGDMARASAYDSAAAILKYGAEGNWECLNQFAED